MTRWKLPPWPWWPLAAAIAATAALVAVVRSSAPPWVTALVAVLMVPQYVAFVAWLYVWRIETRGDDASRLDRPA